MRPDLTSSAPPLTLLQPSLSASLAVQCAMFLFLSVSVALCALLCLIQSFLDHLLIGQLHSRGGALRDSFCLQRVTPLHRCPSSYGVEEGA